MKTIKIHKEPASVRSAPDSGRVRTVAVSRRLFSSLMPGILFLLLLQGMISSAAASEDPPREPHGSSLQESIAGKGRVLSGKHLSTIIVDNYYPYTFMNDQGHADGFSVELIRAVAQVMGLEIDIREGSWNRAMTALENGEIDLLPMMAHSGERDKVFDFTEPHTISFDAVFVIKGRESFRSLDDLRGRTIIVMKNDAAQEYLISKDITSPEKLVPADSLPEALRFLAIGKADAAIMPKLMGLLYMKQMGLDNLEQSPVVVEDYQRRFCFAVKNGNSLLLNLLSEGLSIVKATGTLDQIHRKWFGLVEPAPDTLQSVMKYILSVFAALILATAAFLAWSLSLRKQVATRTKKLEMEIAGHMQAEEGLLEAMQRLELAAASGKLGIWEWRIQDNALQWDDQMFALYGITRNSFPGCVEAWQSGLHPDDREKAIEASRQALEGEKDFDTEFRVVHPDGTVRFLKANAEIIRDNAGKALKMIGINQDITESKHIEEVQSFLAKTSSGTTQEPFFNALARFLALSLGMDFVCIDGLEGDGLTARTVAVWHDGHFEDNMAYALKDTPCGEVVGKTVCSFPAGVCRLFPRDQVLQDLGAESYVGVTIWGHTGRPIGLIAVIGRRPLTERRLAELTLKLVGVRAAGEFERLDAEKALQESQAILKAAMDNSLAGIAIADAPGGVLRYVNDAGLLIRGGDRQSVVNGIGIDQYVASWQLMDLDGSPLESDQVPLVRAIRFGETCSREFIIRRTAGDDRIVLANAGPIRDENDKVIAGIVVFMDITERKWAEDELRRINETLEMRVAQETAKSLKQERLLIQQSRPAAMGEMIGNIAHQWRQPLNALGLLLFNIKEAFHFNTLDAAYLDQAVADGNRLVQKMSTTISDFSNFFRPDKGISTFSALEQIREATALVASSFQNSNIFIHVDAPRDLMLLGFPNEYSQVLLNLLSNAREAILSRSRPLPGRVDIVLSEQNGQGCVSVADNGGGIPQEILDRIFDPYFSTKEKGSGIGLYMSKMIIERNMNGNITAKNSHNGAEFIVASPLAAENVGQKDTPDESVNQRQ
jgi:PAS domain S-box-containing protein